MALYAISDLHLSLGTNKEMDVFGGNWINYVNKLEENWKKIINHDDIILIVGDTSWATYLEECYNDFCFLNSLPGKKIITKGNHDYWWTTINKINNYVKENSFDTLEFLHNSSIMYKDTAICGTRGWIIPGSGTQAQDVKIFEREKIRLSLSLEQAIKRGAKKIIVGIHYPPCENFNFNTDFIDIMKTFPVKECAFGHLHASSHLRAITGDFNGINLHLVSSDYLNFVPKKIMD